MQTENVLHKIKITAYCRQMPCTHDISLSLLIKCFRSINIRARKAQLAGLDLQQATCYVTAYLRSTVTK